MKFRYFAISLFLSIMVLACNDKEDEPNPVTDPNEAESACYVTEYTTTNNYPNSYDNSWEEYKSTINIAYDADYRIKRIDELVFNGICTNGQCIDTKDHLEFLYDNNGKLMQIESYEEGVMYQKAVYDYNSAKQVSKFIIYGEKTGVAGLIMYGYYMYEYNNRGNITNAKFFDASNNQFVEEYKFEYNSSNLMTAIDAIEIDGYRVKVQYEYDGNELVRKAWATADGRWGEEIMFGDKNGAFAATIKKNPLIFNYPVPDITPIFDEYEYEFKKIITNIRGWEPGPQDLLENMDRTGSPTYEFSKEGYPTKVAFDNYGGGKLTTIYKYKCE
ncbi:hypothetical protein [uncultured Pontibacter sp.]|uniref:hypothetical protein n=1 Tax=uncultured Pontibacter sp. TaxID=453356 RepID=UPI002608E641|nr:hypothetical protein [uncultured Pontibacter sp.]